MELVIRGSLIVPVGRPFSKNEASASSPLQAGEEWIAEGFLKILHDHVITVKSGIIMSITPASEATVCSSSGQEILQLGENEFLSPGFVDLHIHAPQYAYTGTATDRTLFEWLDYYTFPAERRLNDDVELARQVYSSVVRTTLGFGTTCAVYHTTLHLKPCQVLVDCIVSAGQRAIVGKVSMDRNSPDDYIQTTEENLTDSERLFDYIYAKCGRRELRGDGDDDNNQLPLVLPSVIPRFIPTCTPALFDGLAKLVKTHNCYITTHISEGLEEVEYSKQCDKQDHGLERTGSEVLESHGLLSDQCVLAHCVHLTNSDCDLLKTRGSAVSHCPLSNFFFGGGTMKCRELLERGNLVGIGTDVAGGYSLSMLHTQRDAVLASRALGHHVENSAIDYRHALWLATLGGAESLKLQHKIGTFRPGMEFDAIVLSPSDSPVQVFHTDSKLDVLQKILVLGDDRNVKKVFVQGRQVK